MALGQLEFDTHGVIRDKVEMAIMRLRAFEPEEGYFLAFSGGKDSQCAYHLCKLAGVKFDAHYSVTSVDPPELVRFIKECYPDVKFERKHDEDGKPITMWSLIPEKRMPPTRLVRYCCEKLKEESSGKYRRVVTGVRWAESVNRKKNQGVVNVMSTNDKKLYKEVINKLDENNIWFTKNRMGGVILNYDNADNAQMINTCLRTTKTLVNPIVDWEESDVWEFLNSNGIPHCCLYDQGFSRLGCIGCLMGGRKSMEREFERWPKYKALYLKAFKRMLDKRADDGLEVTWKTPEEVMDWWIR